MDLQEIKQRIDYIQECADDYERQHAYEDELYLDFVKSISLAGLGDWSAKAKEILRTQEMDFERWCA